MTELKDGERLDDLQRKGYRIIQNPGMFCFGMDAVLLSDFARVKSGAGCLDLGCGNSIIPILMAARNETARFTGLEIQPYSVDMASRSVALNQLENRISIVEGDIRDAAGIFGASSFDNITANPPYITDSRGIHNEKDAMTIARHEVLCTLEDVICQSALLLKRSGHFFMVHRPSRLAQIITLMSGSGLEPKRMRLIYPFIDREPNLVLIEGVAGARPQLTVESPLIVYESPGQYTPEILHIYEE
ncbi:MAG: tRNA1(Val) (adenine(37)-N6)-methyltransferase [Clostridiales bacterium]|nr:tRNA1(Val) (adenine(37)-N6)-methyltransferase [Clostridiales bacterium]